MPKVRLRYAIAIDAVASASGSMDPVVHVYGRERSGRAQPFLVRRGWSGPQGAYVEDFRVVDKASRITAYRSGPRIVELTGEYYTNDVEDRVEDIALERGEYELVFTVDGDVVPGVPVFANPGPGAVGGPAAVVAPIVDEATKKSDLVWLAVPGAPGGLSTRAAWHLWHEGAAYVVHEGGEQRLDGLDDADSVVVCVRSKDKWGLLVAWRAAVERVPPGSATWNEVTPLLVGKRLNLKDAENAPARWAKESIVTRLVPTGELLEDPDNLQAISRAEPPPPSSAATHTHVPITLHGKSRRPPDQMPERPIRA